MQLTEFEQIYRQYAPAVYRRTYCLLGNEPDAKEALQEVFVSALTHWEDFERRSGVMTWLYRIATNHCLNLIKQSRRHQELLRENCKSLLPQDLPSLETLHQIRSILDKLSGQDAQLAVYYYLDEMSHEEIAKIMNCSRRKVGYLIEKIEKRLNQIVKQTKTEGGDEPNG